MRFLAPGPSKRRRRMSRLSRLMTAVEDQIGFEGPSEAARSDGGMIPTGTHAPFSVTDAAGGPEGNPHYAPRVSDSQAGAPVNQPPPSALGPAHIPAGATHTDGDAGASVVYRQPPASRLADAQIWAVVPCYGVKTQITRVLEKMPSWVKGIVLVDDVCPQKSVDHAISVCKDERLRVVRNQKNTGVGGAVLSGYAEAIGNGARIIVKVDGDDQMDLRLMPLLVLPIMLGKADYTKGNRFSSLSHVQGMPTMRVFGNSVLSLLSKISSGYWGVFDPTNGYTAIDARVARELLSRNIARRYFFESDMLYHLSSIRAVVKDVPMPSKYADEKSNLHIFKIVLPFLLRHIRNTFKRFVGHYLVREFGVATIETIVGLTAVAIGLWIGADWLISRPAGVAASAGIVMGSVAPIIIGVQLLLSALNFDVLNTPKEPIHPSLRAMDEFIADFEA